MRTLIRALLGRSTALSGRWNGRPPQHPAACSRPVPRDARDAFGARRLALLARSGRRRHSEWIDGDVTVMVRPYLVAAEQRARREELLLALDGIDAGPWVIHGVPVGAAR